MIAPLLLACRSAPTTSTPLELPAGPIGSLEVAAALELEGDRSFGGWSGAAIERQGEDRVLWAVSDAGAWIRLALRTDDQGRLVEAEETARGALVDEEGSALGGKTWGDAESLIATPSGWIVGFERRHRLLAYGSGPPGPERRGIEGPAVPVALPAGFSAPENGGLEAVGRSEGELVLLVEGDEGATGPHTGWLGGAGSWTPLALARTRDLRPVELTPLGRDLLLVERAWNERDGTTLRLSRLTSAALRSGREITPVELGELRAPAGGSPPGSLPVDNFEAAAADGDTIWLLSDDNFSSDQRTLLLQLRWVPPG